MIILLLTRSSFHFVIFCFDAISMGTSTVTTSGTKTSSLTIPLVSPHRLIEYPSDLSGCGQLEYGERLLLYLCSKNEAGKSFTVILGFFSGQKQDVVTKDLIEPVAEENRENVMEAVRKSIPPEYSESQILFL